MRIKKQKDFWSGVLFVALGLFFACFGSRYAMGTAARMGPGYFPVSLGVLTVLLGIVLSLTSLTGRESGEKVGSFHFPTLLLILGSVVLFGVLLKPLGLIVSLLVLVVVSSYASHEFSWKATLANAAVLVVMCLVVFVWALKLEFPMWPWFIGK